MERVMSELAFYFCQRSELEVHLIMYGRTPDISYKIPDSLIVHKPLRVFNARLRIISTLGRLLYLRNTVKRINPDSILSFGEYWNSFVLLALIGLRYPIFVSDRCSPEMKFGAFHKRLRSILYPMAKGVIAQTAKARELYSSQFRNANICIIGNPVMEIKHPDSYIQRENIVLTVGRIIKTKHHDKLIEIFADISVPGWKLVIVGDDALNQKNMANLKGLIKKLCMEESIILAGNQSDVESYYLRSKIFAFTSTSEGFPNVIGEAMSAGLPVVTFDCIAGPNELIQNEKDGFLVPVLDVKEFSNKLMLLMGNAELCDKLGKHAKENIKKYSISSIGVKYYDFILNKNSQNSHI